MFNEILVKCRFLDENGEPKGRQYTYIYKREKPLAVTTAPLVAFPRYMQTVTGRKVIVEELFTDPKEVEAFADKLAYVFDFEGGAGE